ncbi:MAG: amino acid ABC transporter permease [Oscillospiraceae bacterium]|nr:amino acid ABC transporter permease [Oscillospiraceae bacterium]MCL2279171.1 amino acid ABC transporter permease [Oscillospiraceae bacterium]
MIDTITSAFYRVMIYDDRWRMWLSGLELTLTVTFFALLVGLLAGLTLAIVRVTYDSSAKPNPLLIILNRFAKLYISAIRGIPMVVQLLVWALVILAASRNSFLIATLAFGFNSGAYVSEVFRAGIASIDKGQSEAGRSLGLSYAQTMLKIILPQAIKNCLPAFGNEFISLLKETSIAGMAAIADVTQVGNIIRGRTFDPAPLFFVAAIYLILVLFLEFLIRQMEKALNKSDRRTGKPIAKLKRKGLVRND